MIHDFSIKILAGGRHPCTPAWNKPHDDLDRCHKIYLPVSGAAFLSDDHGEHALTPGNLYLINGHAIRSQRCPVQMELRWMHFQPTSHHLRRRLDRVPLITQWAANDHRWIREVFEQAETLFDNPASVHESRLSDAAPLMLACRVEAMILYLLSMQLEAVGGGADPVEDPRMERLRPAIAFMDNHYRDNPTLAEMASRANLAPNYFHRLFLQVLGQTPFGYIETRRLETAKRLLADPRPTISQIADACGYDDALYFSRAFRRRFGASPAKLRKTLRLTP